MSHSLLRVALAGAMALSLAACSSDDSGAASSTVTVYSPAAGEYGELIKDFNKDHPDIKINAVRLVGPEMETRLRGEVTSGNAVGDVIDTSLTSSAGPWVDGQEDWYANWLPDSASKLPADRVNKEKGYFISDLGAFTVAYNADAVDEADVPQTWDDLLDPKWKGRIALPDPRSQGLSSTVFIALLNDGKIEQSYFDKLAAQEPIITEAAQIGQSLTSGQADLALWGSTYVHNAAAKGANIKINTNLLVGSRDGAAMLKNAPNPEGAKIFLEWLASEKGQQALSDIGFTPSLEGIDRPEGMDTAAVVPEFATAMELTPKVLEQWEKLLG